MEKAPDAFRTISEVSDWLDTPTHVLRFWESRFPEVAPVKRAGGRRYYRVEDIRLLGGIKKLLHEDGVTIKALQDRIKSEGSDSIAALSPPLGDLAGGGADEPSETPADAGSPTFDEGLPAVGNASRKETGEAHPAPPLRRAYTRPAAGQTADETPAAEPPPITRERPRAPLAGSQRTLSFPEDIADEPATPSGASFQRHPARVRRDTSPKPAPAKPSAREHPSRPGLFLYDDSDLQSSDAADASAASVEKAMVSIDQIPLDPEDDCASPAGVPLVAEIRALTALVSIPVPADVQDAISRLHALRNRWT